MHLRGRGCSGGAVKGVAAVSARPFGFWQGIDPRTGDVIDHRHDLYGRNVAGKIMVFPYSRGSTGAPGIFLEAVRNHAAPAAMVVSWSEPMLTLCALVARTFYDVEVPVVDSLEGDGISLINDGDILLVNGQDGTVEILERRASPGSS